MRLRVLSWNVHKCVGGLDRRYDPARIAHVIADCAADVVLLQEVAQDGTWYRGERQVDVLGNLLGIPHRSYFVNVRFGRRRGAYGNAILSRWPIATTENLDLTVPRRKRRSVLHASLRIPGHRGEPRHIDLFNLHLGLSERERREQLRRFLACAPFAALGPGAPVVVAGDFNDIWGTLGRTVLAPAGFRGMARPLRTFPAWAPVRAIDAIYVRGDVRLSGVHSVRTAHGRRASDHLGLLAELHLGT